MMWINTLMDNDGIPTFRVIFCTPFKSSTVVCRVTSFKYITVHADSESVHPKKLLSASTLSLSGIPQCKCGVLRPLKELQPAPAWPRAATWSCITGAPIPMRPMEQSRKGPKRLQSHGS